VLVAELNCATEQRWMQKSEAKDEEEGRREKSREERSGESS
jgi:hypothetical protein